MKMLLGLGSNLMKDKGNGRPASLGDILIMSHSLVSAQNPSTKRSVSSIHKTAHLDYPGLLRIPLSILAYGKVLNHV